MPTPIEQIKGRLDIADVVGGYLKLQKAGINLKARCPFHNEKTPSFFVSPTRQSWHCFGCNKGGDIFSFIQEIEGIDFTEALKILAQRAGVELKREPKVERDAREALFNANELAAQFFTTQLDKSSAGLRAQEYLSKRGLRKETIESFRLGWAPEQNDALISFLRLRGFNAEQIEKAGLALSDRGHGSRDRFRGRVVFPIFDGSSRVVGFTGRIFGREESEYDPKYLNTSETPIFEKSRILYGLHAARKSIRKEGKTVLVEGQMDCLMAHQAGSENTVATSGTALTEQHLSTLSRLADTLIIAFDSDSAGVEAAKRGIEMALEAGLAVRLAIVPKGKDPAELIATNAAAWKDLLEKETKPVIGFLLERALAVNDIKSAEGKRAVVNAVLPMLQRMSNAVERSKWISEIASSLQLPVHHEQALWEEVGKKKQSPIAIKSSKEIQSNPETGPVSRRQLLEEHLIALYMLQGSFPELNDLEKLFSVSPTKELSRTAATLAGLKGMEFPIRLAAFHSSVEDAHKLYAERIAFKAEALNGVVSDISDEINSCIREIRTIDLRDRLDAISIELEAAERGGDSLRVRELAEQFREYSAALSTLFSQSAPVQETI